MDSPTARMATQTYRKPEVFELGAVHELTCWSADAWGQMKKGDTPDAGAAATGTFSGGH